MKSIANQYRDLKEGKMSQANFMRNLRMSMPQVTNTTSFGDAVRILKNKGIITETYINTDKPLDNFDEAEVLSKGEFEPEESNDDAEFDAILKQLEDEMAGEIAVKSDVLDEPLEEINEAKQEKAKIQPDENIQEVSTGIEMEHLYYPEESYETIRNMVKKNLKKNPNYYTNFKLTGIRDYEIQTMDDSKPETHQMKFYTEKTAVDTARGMKKVKMPKKEEKKKLKENIDAPHSIKADQEIDKSELNFLKKAYADRSTDKIPEKSKKIMQDLEDRIAAREKNEAMRFQDLPADPEKYKMVKDSKGKIIKATNAEGNEFQRGDEVIAYDGEKIKIADFKEEQGKIKALYNKGMFFATIDIDGLEAPKETMRPGVDIGKSFEKFKLKDLKEMVRQAMAEMYDGRDNLTNITDDTKD